MKTSTSYVMALSRHRLSAFLSRLPMGVAKVRLDQVESWAGWHEVVVRAVRVVCPILQTVAVEERLV